MLQPNVTHIYNTYAHIYVYTHTHIYIHIYIYIYIYICVCVWTPANGCKDVVWDCGGAALG
jgi:hypothetical protein